MSDATDFYGLIEEIRVALVTRTSFPQTEGHWSVGKVQKDRHAYYPRVEWVETGGTIDYSAPTLFIGGEDGDIAADLATFSVAVWAADEQQTKALLYDLMRATREVTDGPSGRFGTYEWVGDANINAGRKLVVDATLYLPVKAEVEDVDYTLGTIETFSTEVQGDTSSPVTFGQPTP